MKNKLRCAITALLALFATVLWAEEAGQTCVVVEQTNGSCTEFLLQNEPRLSYDGTTVRMVSSTATLELAQADVRRVYLAETSTGISSPNAAVSVARVVLTADGVSLSGLEPGSSASVATADGRLLSAGRALPDGTLTLSLPNVHGGVVIVRTSNQSFKILKK